MQERIFKIICSFDNECKLITEVVCNGFDYPLQIYSLELIKHEIMHNIQNQATQKVFIDNNEKPKFDA